MFQFRRTTRLSHPALRGLTEDRRQGRISRRDFLTRATALGLVAGMAPVGSMARADAPQIKPGGTLRIQQAVKALKDPRSYDWSELGNQTRGFLEYLVQYNADGSFTGMLLESWEANENATQYRFGVRRGVTWNNGDAFTAADVARNLARWCDSAAPGNSMSARLASLMDPATGQLREDAVTILDDHTLTLDLSTPDIALIANLSDYPAAVMHASYDGGDPFAHGIGTGPFRPVEHITDERAVLERNPDHTWWGADIFGGPYVDRVEFIDYGTDPSSWIAAAEAGEVDLLYESVGDFIDVLDTLGWTRTEADSSATMVVRANAAAEVDGPNPYANAQLRRALALAVNNEICLELGYAGRGRVASNDHVSPIQPAYADLGPSLYDPAQARADVAAAGFSGFEHRLVTIDDEWQRNTGDAVAAQLRDAGINVTRQIEPAGTYLQNWDKYPFSATQWNHRPLAVQVLNLAYRSGAVWNETGFASEEFDALLDQASAVSDADTRRETMGELQRILRDEGVIIQPYWRALYNHHNGQLVGAEKHPSNEIHLYKIGFAA